jgi:hypothetical protein
MNASTFLRFFAAFLLFILPSQAILDTNSNGLSDVWEKQYNNGYLFPNTFLASNDDDQDGWSNAIEAVAGTNPFDPNPPDGVVAVNITPSLAAGAFTLSWQTLLGKSYQLEASTDMVLWLNVGEPIKDTYGIHYRGVNTTQPDQTIPARVFWRVSVSDSDQDNDGLTDAEEYFLGTDHQNAQTLHGVPDKWLAIYLYDILIDEGVNSISLDADEDNDGATTAEEFLNGTDPQTPDPPAAQRWMILNGDSAQDVEKTRTKTVTIPKGKSALFIVAIASNEYDYYTDPENAFEYNDQLRWEITPEDQAAISGQVYVNDRHFDWIIAEINDQTIPGIQRPVHYETMRIITAPADSDLEIEIEIGATNINDGSLPSQIAIGYEPIEINSLDRFVKGSIPLSVIERYLGGEDQFGLQIIGKTSQQTLGHISVDDAYIHSEGYLNSEVEAAKPLEQLDPRTWQQNVIYFIKDDKLHFATTMDQIETIEIKLYQDEEEKGKGEYSLTALPDVAKLIQSLDQSFREAPFANNGIIPPQYIPANNSPEYEDLFSDEEPTVPVANVPPGFTPLEWRNLTTRCLNEVYDAIQLQIPIIAGQISATNDFLYKSMVAFARGYSEGIWSGLKSDWEGLVELKNLLLHPIDTVQGIVVGIKELLGLTGQQWKDMGQHMFASMIKASKDALPWELQLNNGPDILILQNYVVGYGQGFVTEQACMVFLGAGAVSKIGQTVKVILQSSKLGRLGIELAAKGLDEARNIARQTKTSAQRYWSQFAESESDLHDIAAQLEKSHKRPGEVGENKHFLNPQKAVGEALEQSESLTMEKVLKELGDENDFRTLNARDMVGKCHVMLFQRRCGQLLQTLIKGDAYSDEAIVGFSRLYKHLVKNHVFESGNEVIKDRVTDISALFSTMLNKSGEALNAQEIKGAKALAKSLEAYKTATDTDINAKLWFKDVDKVYQKGYRYSNFDPRFDKDGNPVAGPPKLNVHEAEGWYSGFESIDSSAAAKARYQLPLESTAKYRLEFDWDSVKDNVRVPRGKKDTANWHEPACLDYPENGAGKGLQVLIDGAEVPIKRIWDISGETPQLLYQN